MLSLVFVFLSSLLIGWFLSIPVIWVLKVFRIGQVIRQEGPASHRRKAGTPTMGGFSIVFTILTLMLIMINVDLNVKYAALLGLFAGYSILGFADDFAKIRARQNTGLTALQKIFGQVAIASIFAGALVISGHTDGVGGILKYMYLDNPYLYFPFIVLVIAGASNAVNLTDGLDGLAAGTVPFAFIAFAFVAYSLQYTGEAVICAIAGGATLSFLRVNLFPAEVFMGDVSSLSLGALLGGVAVLCHKELLLIVIGGVFVVEAFSVILQVSTYKLFRARIFRMSPLHHHFELGGMREQTVVAVFCLAAAVFAALGVWLGVNGVL